MSGKSSGYSNRMALQSYTETRDAAKQMVKTWSDEAALWAKIEFAYKGEEMLGGVRQSKTPVLASVSQVWLYTRYRTDVVFSPRKRIRFGTRYFEIISFYVTEGHGKEFKILCHEVQP